MSRLSDFLNVKSLAVISPHLICCVFIPALGASSSLWFEWAENIWVRLIVSLVLTLLAVWADEKWHQIRKTDHCGPCDHFGRNQKGRVKKYLFWAGLAIAVTFIFEALEPFLHWDE